MTTLNLIPIPKNEKACKLKGWQNLDYQSPAHLKMLKNHQGNFGFVVPSSLLVLDVDTKEGKVGAESLAALEALHGKLPDGPVQQTASGGLHLVFSLNPGVTVKNSAGKVGKDLDIRSAGQGYIVVEPSTIDGKSYKWIKDSPNDSDKWNPPLAPSWLVKLATQDKTPARRVNNQGSGIADTKQIVPSASYEGQKYDESRIRSLLASISADKAQNYDTYLKVGLALCNWSQGSEVGLALWDTWSQQAPNYEAGVCAKKWGSFEPSEIGGVTVASLFHLSDKTFANNDEGLCARLAMRFSKTLKYCPAFGWLVFKH